MRNYTFTILLKIFVFYYDLFSHSVQIVDFSIVLALTLYIYIKLMNYCSVGLFHVSNFPNHTRVYEYLNMIHFSFNRLIENYFIREVSFRYNIVCFIMDKTIQGRAVFVSIDMQCCVYVFSMSLFVQSCANMHISKHIW